jgi:heptosyltransferase-1
LAILIVKLSALGDVVQTLPSLKLIKECLPNEDIFWVIEEAYKDLLYGHSQIVRLFTPPKDYLKSPRELFKLFKEVRSERFDLVIDYQGLLKSGVICGMARAKYKVGFSNHREGSPLFYTHRLSPYDPELHAVLRYLKLTRSALKLLGVSIPQEFNNFRDIPRDIILPEEKVSVLSIPYFVIVPSARWKTKEWLPKNWEDLIEKLLIRFPQHTIYLVGSGDHKVWAEEVSKKFPRVFTLFDKLSLKELVYVIRNSEVVITVDTGPMHIASALDKPIVALFGPTASNRTGPWSTIYRVVKVDLPCRPCFKRTCEDMLCMKKITPEMVLNALEEMGILS